MSERRPSSRLAVGLFSGRALRGQATDSDEDALPAATGDSGDSGALAQAAAARLRRAGRHLAQSLRLMVGVPDYDGYVAHLRRMHPEREPMSYAAFFRERQQARYGGGSGRCC